jgi:putative ABC transport system ATP-binding protein
MNFDSGKIYTIVGKSGAGKTTLLSVLSSLARPTGGEILLDDKDVAKIDRYKFRSKYVGVIFQNFNLLTHLTALENVVLSMDISGKKFDRPKKEIALELLIKVGLNADEAKRRVLKLSGGQQQRVAIARALSYDPDIILADEPTGNLDGETQDEIIGIFKMLADEGKCVIIVTHSPDVAAASDITYELKKGA